MWVLHHQDDIYNVQKCILNNVHNLLYRMYITLDDCFLDFTTLSDAISSTFYIERYVDYAVGDDFETRFSQGHRFFSDFL